MVNNGHQYPLPFDQVILYFIFLVFLCFIVELIAHYKPIDLYCISSLVHCFSGFQEWKYINYAYIVQRLALKVSHLTTLIWQRAYSPRSMQRCYPIKQLRD